MKLASCYSSFEFTVTLRGQIQCRRARSVLLVVSQSPVITLMMILASSCQRFAFLVVFESVVLLAY